MNWSRGPPVLVGERILWSGNACSKPKIGVIKWIGTIPEKGPDWCVGIELDEALPALGGDGFWKERKLFECRSKHGLLVPIEEIQKLPSKAQTTSDSNRENQNCAREFSAVKNTTHRTSQLQNQYVMKSLQKSTNRRKKVKNSETSESNFFVSKSKETSEDSQILDSKAYINELLKNMNEVAGYFKEIKEGEERFDKQEENETNNVALYENNGLSRSKPKKLFSFLKWFNKKNKHEPNLKLFRDSSTTSSPIFPRKETSSCESIDTLFSTQTVRSFAYIPPTQYKPSAPPLDYDLSSFENDSEDFSLQKKKSEETESIYERRKKRRAPEPPRFSRENSLPSTLEHKKIEDADFDGIKTFHRRTVSESFKDKKAGSYCHVQGKRKAPPPPAVPLYPNLQKLNNQYPSMHKKKKPAPLPPDFNFENQNQTRKDIQKQKETSQPTEEQQKEKPKGLKESENEEKDAKGIKFGQTPKERLTKEVSLSPLPSRPWYKRSHRDSTGNNIIRKDLLKGFEKKKNKETDDWMPEVGFPRRSLSTESHSKFNIFSKLEKVEDKKKEEKRKSQISILTNISELDREAAEILKKEQAEEKKMLAANDAKYYSPKEIKEKNRGPLEMTSNMSDCVKVKIPLEKDKGNDESSNPKPERTGELKAIVDHVNTKETGESKDQMTADVKVTEDILKNKENKITSDGQSNGNPKENSFSPTALTNSSNLSPIGKITKPSQTPPQARLNFFNVQSKELNYLNEPWVCQKCTLENPGWRVFCEICSAVKPKFSFYNATPKSSVDSAETSKPIELKPAVEDQNAKPTALTSKSEKGKETTPAESLDEMRRKRMNFFSAKVETSDKNESESNSNDINMKPNENSMIKNDLVLNYKAEEKNDKPKITKETETNNEEHIKRKPEEETGAAHIKGHSEKESFGEQKNKENLAVSKENTSAANGERNQNSQTNLISNKPNIKNDSREEKVIEAYVVTKTVVLEDIIVKKPERGKKVSASVQTKSTISKAPETKAIRPPPRTKKIVFESSSEGNKGKEPESPSENGSHKLSKDYRQEDLDELTNKLTQAEGLADFRAKIETMPLNTEMNTVAVNRLLRKLEAAISCGDHFVAAGLAKELALMKINCSVTRQVTPSPGTSKITTELYIEDKLSHQGPIPLEVLPTMNLLQLKKKIQQEFGIPLEVQRWILGKKLATDDNKTLESEGVRSDYCPLFLYLVAPEIQKTDKETSQTVEKIPDSHQLPQSTEQNPGPKTGGWYYNYEEDHYSYCEDSEDDSKSSTTDLNSKIIEITEKEENTDQISTSNVKKTGPMEDVKKPEKVTVFDIKSKEAEYEAEKELKFISVNSVKQKIEQLNRTFAENSEAVKPPLRSSRSPETWKCGACKAVNLKGRLNCLYCNSKKLITEPNQSNSNNKKGEEPIRRENTTASATADVNVHYKALIELQDADLVVNSEPFTCSICLVDYAVGEGVTLKDCLHTFCRTCLIGTVQYSEDAEIKCPYLDDTYSCQSVLQQREIKALVPQGIFELHLAKSVKEAENKIGNAFHCKTPDCKGWCIYEDNVNQFRCPVCRSINCLTCQTIHNGMNCKEYQERMKVASETDVDAKKTRDMLNEMVEKGEAMVCPKCQVVLMKKWGCDWLKCSMCKTEICWVTRGFRWGPEGKGDTSGGCKCGVNGVKCHPKCNYCH